MSKDTYISTEEFLAGILGETVDLQIAGFALPVKVRGLEFVDIQRIDRLSKGDELQAALHMASVGLVEPKLTPEQLSHARPGVIRQITKAVRELSGMSDGEEDAEKKETLPGDGS